PVGCIGRPGAEKDKADRHLHLPHRTCGIQGGSLFGLPGVPQDLVLGKSWARITEVPAVVSGSGAGGRHAR
ncbi:MAG: hypothetical protein ACRDP7_38960, partial [Trebonia sp.]